MHRNNFFWLAVCVGLVALAVRYSPRQEPKSPPARVDRGVRASVPVAAPAPAAVAVETVMFEPAEPAVSPEPVVQPEATRAVAPRGGRSAPVVITLEIRQDKATRKVEVHYGELFRQLTAQGVDPSVLRLMLFEREMLMTSGLVPNEGADQGRTQMAAIKRTVGKAVFDYFSHYNGNLPERLLANDLARRLEGTSDALTEQQREWFIVTLHSARASDGTRQLTVAPPWFDEFRYPVRVIPHAAKEALQPGLTSAQMAAFRTIESEQEKRHPNILR